MKYYLLLIFKVFFSLSLSTVVALFFTSFGIFGHAAFTKSNSLAAGIISLTEGVIFLHLAFNYITWVIIFGFYLAWPALYFLSFPYCLYLKFNKIESFFKWVIPVTLIGFVYSFLINYVLTNATEFKLETYFWVIIFTSTAFITSIFTWFFCNKLLFKLNFGLSKPEESFQYYLTQNSQKIKLYLSNVVWPEINIFRNIDIYVAWRWLILLFITLFLFLYVAQSIYLFTFPVTYGGLRKYIDWPLGFIASPFALLIRGFVYIILLYALSIILMSKKIKNLYIWLLSFSSLGAVYSIVSYIKNVGLETEMYRDLIFIVMFVSFFSGFAMRHFYIKSNIHILRV